MTNLVAGHWKKWMLHAVLRVHFLRSFCDVYLLRNRSE